MEWLVFFGVVLWLSCTAVLWLRVSVLQARAAELAGELAEARQACAKIQETIESNASAGTSLRPAAAAAPAGNTSGSLNFSRRVQVLRLHRRGESVSHIAASLGLTGAEAELIIKLHAPGLTVSPSE